MYGVWFVQGRCMEFGLSKEDVWSLVCARKMYGVWFEQGRCMEFGLSKEDVWSLV